MIFPLDSWYPTQYFGEAPQVYAQFGMAGHNGEDGLAAIGTPVRAPEDGMVYISFNNPKDQYTGSLVGGETVVLRGKYEHWLLHNSKRLVDAGDMVKRGQIIALSGDTGFVDGPHCHWGVRPLNPQLDNGYRGFINPRSVIKEKEQPMPAAEEVTYMFENGFDRAARQDELDTYTTHDWPTLVHAIFESNEFKSRLGNDPKATALVDAIKNLIT